METEPQAPSSLLKRRATRRAVVGAGASAAALAALYAIAGKGLVSSGGNEPGGTGVTSAEEADALKREDVRISHLLRRAGFGVTRAEYDRYQSMGLEGDD